MTHKEMIALLLDYLDKHSPGQRGAFLPDVANLLCVNYDDLFNAAIELRDEGKLYIVDNVVWTSWVFYRERKGY